MRWIGLTMWFPSQPSAPSAALPPADFVAAFRAFVRPLAILRSALPFLLIAAFKSLLLPRRRHLHGLAPRLLVLALLWGLEPAAAAECGRPALAHVNELLEEGRRRILVLEHSEARRLLEEAVSCLTRLDAVVPTPTLGRLFMDLGVARLQLGDERGANEAFRRASIMAPGVRWETRLGARSMGAYLSIKEDALLSPLRRIRFPALMPDASAALDGMKIEGRRELSIPPGIHLLQVREDPSTPWVGRFIEVPASESIPPLEAGMVGRIFRSNLILGVDPAQESSSALLAGPPLRVKRATVVSAAAASVLGAAALTVALLSRQAVLNGEFETLEEGEAMRTRSNLALGTGLGFSGAGLALAGAGITLYFGYRPDREEAP